MRIEHQVTYAGAEQWSWAVWIEGSSAELDAIDYVEYTLDPTFPDPVRRVYDRETKFRLESSARGAFEINAHAFTTGGTEQHLSDWLILEYPDSEVRNPPADQPRTHPRVLVSYAAADANWGQVIQDALRQHDYDAFSTDDMLQPGTPWHASIASATDEADLVIAVFSDAPSPWVEREVSRAVTSQVTLVPFAVGPKPVVPDWLKSTQAIRVNSPSDVAAAIGSVARDYPRMTLKGHTGSVHAVAFSPSGAPLLASGGDDGIVRLWDLTSRKPIKTLDCEPGWVRSVAFSPDGQLLATGGNQSGTIRLWDPANGQIVRTLEGHDGLVNGMAFSPVDAHLLASASNDNTVRLWDTISGRRPIATLTGHRDIVQGVAVSPDGRQLASGGNDHFLRVWTLPAAGRATATAIGDPTVVIEDRSRVFGVAFSHDGQLLASAGEDGTVRLWDVASGRFRAALPRSDGSVNGVAFSPVNAHLLAGASNDGTVRLWDPTSRQLAAALRGHNGPVFGVAFSRDGSQLAGAGDDGTVRLWSMAPFSEATA